MNDYGKSCISTFGADIFFLFILLAVMPFYYSNGNAMPFENITGVQVSELVCWCSLCAFVFLGFWVLGHLISGVCCYAVYFFQRILYIRKLYKPERVYTGDPL